LTMARHRCLPREVRELIRISRAAGRDPALVQGGGGNTSAKSADGRFMYVKASGTTLAGMSPGIGYRRLRLASVLEILHDDTLLALPARERDAEVRRRLVAACDDDLAGVPSVETPLHAFLGRYVVHIHPKRTNGLLCARDGKAAVQRIFGKSGHPPLYVGWRFPGLPLARSVFEEVGRFRHKHGRPPELIFLQNHGVFSSDDDPDIGLSRARGVEAKTTETWKTVHSPPSGGRMTQAGEKRGIVRRMREALRSVWTPHLGSDVVVSFSDEGAVAEFVCRSDAPKLLRAGALTPDQLAYAHGVPLWVKSGLTEEQVCRLLADKLTAAMRTQSGAPRAVAVQNVGLFVMESNGELLDMATMITTASIDSLLVAADFGGPRGISRPVAAFIEGWDYERFRRQVASKG
jgi:rhamnose utilization protein RhaD (predicted bifunctional aldolase and dehydrogenase)